MTASALSYKEHEVCITTAAGGKKKKKREWQNIASIVEESNEYQSCLLQYIK